jgi:hydrogenase nickel insertion protein HypA
MHEASVTEALVKIATEEATKQGAKKVNAINLVVGETTGYMAESLEFYFRNFTRGTILEGTALNVSYVKPKIKCSSCGELFERKLFSFDCPKCGGQGVMTSVGNEFYIDTMDIEKE